MLVNRLRSVPVLVCMYGLVLLLATRGVQAQCTYHNVILGDSPFAYWRLNEAAGAPYMDATGGNRSLTGGAAGPPAQPSQMSPITSNPADRSVRVPDGLRTSAEDFPTFVSTSFAIEAWVRPESPIGPVFRTIAGRLNPEGSTTESPFSGYALQFKGTALRLMTSNLAGTYYYNAVQAGAGQEVPFNFAPNNWYHVVASANALDHTVTFYVNGVALGTVPYQLPGVSRYGFYIGVGYRHVVNPVPPEAYAPWNGLIDEVALYAHTLSAVQVQSHFNAAGGQLTVTMQPVSRTICNGAPAQFIVAATASGQIAYQWRRNEVNIENATDATLTLPSASFADAGQYDCIASTACGSVTSGPATLTVNDCGPPGAAPSTVFTYHGELIQAGAPGEGAYDMLFRLYSTEAGATQIGATLCMDNLAVSAGKFTVLLDFGNVFSSTARYIEFDVRADVGTDCTALTGFTTLSPRQLLTQVPQAIYAQTAGTALSVRDAENAAMFGGHPPEYYTDLAHLTGQLPASSLTGGVQYSQLPATVARLDTPGIFTARPAFNGGASGSTPPFTVGSSFKVTNLNADLLDGRDSSQFVPAVGPAFIESNVPGSAALSAWTTGSDLASIGAWGSALAQNGQGTGIFGTCIRGEEVPSYIVPSSGVSGFSDSGIGVGGITNTGNAAIMGVVREGTGAAIWGDAGSPDADAGLFRGRARVTQNLFVDSDDNSDGYEGLCFGPLNTGEIIASNRIAGTPNYLGLDFVVGHSPRLSITNDGLIGIGTATPSVTLDVVGDSRFSGRGQFTGSLFVDSDDDTNGNDGLRFGPLNTGEVIGSNRLEGFPNRWGLDFYTGYYPRLSITNDGNVGVGTTAPSAPLDVNGLVNSSALRVTGPAEFGSTIRFPDGTEQQTALPTGTIDGQILVWSTNSRRWVVTGGTGIPPTEDNPPPPPPPPAGQADFENSGTFVVPPNVTTIFVQLWGPGGGGGLGRLPPGYPQPGETLDGQGGAGGGSGAYAAKTITVVPGQLLVVGLGQPGDRGINDPFHTTEQDGKDATATILSFPDATEIFRANGGKGGRQGAWAACGGPPGALGGDGGADSLGGDTHTPGVRGSNGGVYGADGSFRDCRAAGAGGAGRTGINSSTMHGAGGNGGRGRYRSNYAGAAHDSQGGLGTAGGRGHCIIQW